MKTFTATITMRSGVQISLDSLVELEARKDNNKLIGLTIERQPSARVRKAYLCLSEVVAITTADDEEPAHV